jgi:protein TonB
MPRSRDLLTYLGALALHAALAYSFLRIPPPRKKAPAVIEMEVRRPPPPPPPAPMLTPPEPLRPPPEPPPPRRVVTRNKPVTPPQTVTPKPNAEPPKEPPKEPPAPVFGVTMDSVTAGDSSFAVPVGNTTMIDPSKSAKHGGAIAPLPAAPPGPPPERPYQPVSALHIKTMPNIDGDECGRGVPYPDKARAQGIEGNVILRVSLDENGRVHEVKVVVGLGYGLDEAAMRAIRTSARCKFSPAIANDGKPVAYVIPAYTFHFELPR